MNNDPCKAFKKICFWDKSFEKQIKTATHMDLWKYGQILIIKKSLTSKWLRFSNKIFLMNLSSYITSYIESQWQIWNVNQFFFFHFVMVHLDD
jgi:hypothetical protein